LRAWLADRIRRQNRPVVKRVHCVVHRAPSRPSWHSKSPVSLRTPVRERGAVTTMSQTVQSKAVARMARVLTEQAQ
jgi:hypothetical protein